jgi:hypothetical protein
MATSVQIELMVDEKGAVSGVRAFDTSVKASAGSVGRLNTELRAVGAAGDAGTKRASQGMKELGGHALTSLDNVRLLRDDLGIRIPRAMEKAIASSRVLSGMIGGIGTGLIAFGAIEIGMRVFQGAIEGSQKLWHNYLALNSAAKDYQDQVDKTRDEEFGNSRDIETTTLRIREATQAAKDFRAAAEATNHAGWGAVVSGITEGNTAALGAGIGMLNIAHQEAGVGIHAQSKVDQLTPQQIEQRQELLKLQNDLNHAADGEFEGHKKINAELQKRYGEIADERKRDINRSVAHGNTVDPQAGAEKERVQREIARREAAAETFRLDKEQGQELAHMREQGLEASLRGIAVYRAQEEFAIKELGFKEMDSDAAREAVRAKFHGEEMKRLREQESQIQKMREEAQLSGKTGVARVQQEGQNRVSDVYRNDAGLNPGQMLAEIKIVHDQTAQQIAELNKSFKERVDEVVGQSAARELQGFAKIRADAENEIRTLAKEMPSTPEGKAQFARGSAGINAGARGQAADLARKNEEETEQIETQARVKFLDAEKQKTAGIEVEYSQRVQKLKAQLNAQEISEQDYNRRVAAAAQERDAEMIEASTAARQKMAEQFDQLFKGLDHPMKMLENLGDKVAGEAAASLVQRLQQRGGAGSGQTQSTGVGVLDDVLGGFGIKRSKMPGAGADRDAEMPGARGHATEKVFSISQATIHIGSAMFAGSGGAGAPGGGWTSPGGSTGLLASGVSGASGGFGGPQTATPDLSGSFGPDGTFTSASASGGAGGGTASPASFGGGSGGPVPQRGGLLSGMASDVSQGMGLFKGAKNIFGAKGGANNGSGLAETTTPDLSGTINADGTLTSAKSGNTNGGMFGGGGIGANAEGAIGGALGVYSAVEGTGGVGGALKGGMSGMQLGMSLGGPLGAGIGLAAGAIVGAIGIGGREQARVYDLKQVRPKLLADQDAYAQGTMDYTSAYSDVQQMIGSTWAATKKMGPAAESYWGDTIKPELMQAMGKFDAEQRAGRSMYTAQGASYAVGTPYVPHDMTAQIHEGEGIFRADQNEVLTRSVGGLADLHSAYKASMSRGSTPSGGGDRTMNMNVHTIDSQGVAQFFDKYKHHMRSALNDSNAENSGGGL